MRMPTGRRRRSWPAHFAEGPCGKPCWPPDPESETLETGRWSADWKQKVFDRLAGSLIWKKGRGALNHEKGWDRGGRDDIIAFTGSIVCNDAMVVAMVRVVVKIFVRLGVCG